MGSSQMIIMAGAIMILGMISLQIFSSIGQSTGTDLYYQSMISGTGIAQSLVEEVQGKKFDQQTISKTVTSADSLTPVSSLGPDAGETYYYQFNDVDDYDNHTRIDSLKVFGNFYSKVDVYYVENMNPDVTSASPTFAKRIDVKTYNKYLNDTIRLTGIKTY